MKGISMARKELEDSRIVSVRLPDDLLQRLDRSLDWRAWLDPQEQLAGLLEPQTLRRQFQATYNSIRPPRDGVPIHQLRQLLRWPRERFDTVLEALRADHQVDLEALKEHAFDAPAPQDSYHVHGQCYVWIRWRD